VGWVPREGDIDLSGLAIPSEDFVEATAIRADEWTEEIRSQGEFFRTLDPYMPRSLELQRELLASSVDLGSSGSAKNGAGSR
jgi:phosphoenolpyruvate carboxykinase (GTP)